MNLCKKCQEQKEVIDKEIVDNRLVRILSDREKAIYKLNKRSNNDD